MEDLVLTVEQCKHLQELGLDMSDSKLIYGGFLIGYILLERGSPILKGIDHIIPTYTLQEILDKLPFEISDNKYRYELFIDYSHNTVFYYNFVTHEELHSEQAESYSILDSVYNMLCWVIKKEHLKIK